MSWMKILARLIACPIAVAIGDYFFAGIEFAAPSQWIAVGVVMAVIATALDTLFVNRHGWVGSSLLFIILVSGITRLTPSIMPEVETTRLGSIGLGVLLGLVQVVMHWSFSGAPSVLRAR